MEDGLAEGTLVEGDAEGFLEGVVEGGADGVVVGFADGPVIVIAIHEALNSLQSFLLLNPIKTLTI